MQYNTGACCGEGGFTGGSLFFETFSDENCNNSIIIIKVIQDELKIK